jgi:hypothetical protein
MSKDGERLKNFLIYKIYATDKEVEEMQPGLIFLGIVAIIIVLFVICC